MDTPVFSGVKRATMPELISMSSAIATGGAVTLFHIPGVTPEFQDIDAALNFKEPEKSAVFGEKELDSIYARFAGKKGEAVHRIILGCPHYTIFQIQDVVDKLKGAKVAPGVEFVININPQTRNLAREMKYDQVLKEAGVLLISGTCQIIGCGCPSPVYCYAHPEYSSGTVVTDSLKAAVYSPSSLNAARVILADTASCIAAAIAGEWR